MKTQNEQIKSHLELGHELTPMSALKLFKCMRLASRINDLKKQGLPIHSEMVKSGKKRFAKYFLKSFDN